MVVKTTYLIIRLCVRYVIQKRIIFLKRKVFTEKGDGIMSILNKLIEKKDLELYLKLRIEYLELQIHTDILNTLPKHREKLKQRQIGRLRELHKLLTELNQNNIRNKGIFYWRKNKELSGDNYEKLCLL